MAAAFRLLLLACCAVLLHAQAGLLVPTGSGRPDAAVLSLREMTVEVDLGRGYARVNVLQVFENHTPSAQEGTYRFALPPSAAVGDFAVWDGLRRIPGVILEKRRARSIYQELERQRIDPGLLQQGEEEDQRPGGTLFSAAITPIPALATKRLELQFQQEVPYLGGLGEFRLALRPPDAEPPVADRLTVRVRLEDAVLDGFGSGLALQAAPEGAAFSGQGVKLDRDLVVRFRPRGNAPLRLSAFRNPDGLLPDGLALAPWERPADIPPERDGFFLLEALPPGAAGAARAAAPRGPGAVTLAILFDTGLGHRWGGLETAYGQLVRVLQALGPEDRFALIPYDLTPGPASLQAATPQAVQTALAALRQRPLGPGTDLARALGAARALLGDHGRILLLTGAQGPGSGRALRAAAGPLPLFTAVSSGDPGPALAAASEQLLAPTATELEGDLFFQRLLTPGAPARSGSPGQGRPPFTVAGGEPRLHDIYPVLVQPPEPGALSGWVGRYAAPGAGLQFQLRSPLLPGGGASLKAALPERALDARDLPRRWARARVDDLLGRIEADGERRDWIEEVIALSRRYKFVTPYTAFLAAPRALLRPRRIQPGDPVLRVECDPGTVAATALLPFGLKLELAHRPASTIWEGRFLVPEGLKDGRYPVRILVRDRSGARSSETKHFVLDGKTPGIRPQLPAVCRAGTMLRIAAAADQDVVFLSARVGDGAPVPLRWDAREQRSVGLVWIPPGSAGSREVLFEAVDAARNRGFAHAVLEVRP
ncbi:MAG: VIT domain-containing protein [Holophaga sp.]|nr:VIT domain-containing protein [Holophaga sp.]